MPNLILRFGTCKVPQVVCGANCPDTGARNLSGHLRLICFISTLKFYRPFNVQRDNLLLSKFPCSYNASTRYRSSQFHLVMRNCFTYVCILQFADDIENGFAMPTVNSGQLFTWCYKIRYLAQTQLRLVLLQV